MSLEIASLSNDDAGLYQVGLRAVYLDDLSEEYVCSVELEITEAEAVVDTVFNAVVAPLETDSPTFELVDNKIKLIDGSPVTFEPIILSCKDDWNLSLPQIQGEDEGR